MLFQFLQFENGLKQLIRSFQWQLQISAVFFKIFWAMNPCYLHKKVQRPRSLLQYKFKTWLCLTTPCHQNAFFLLTSFRLHLLDPFQERNCKRDRTYLRLLRPSGYLYSTWFSKHKFYIPPPHIFTWISEQTLICFRLFALRTEFINIFQFSLSLSVV
jgi:hypothetical protein